MFLNFSCDKIHLTEGLPSQPFSSVQFTRVKYILTVVQPLQRPSPNSFHLPPWKLRLHQTTTPAPPPLAPTTLLSVSVNLMTLGSSHEWDHIGFFLVCLAYCTHHNVLKIHPCCSLCQNCILFLIFKSKKKFFGCAAWM